MCCVIHVYNNTGAAAVAGPSSKLGNVVSKRFRTLNISCTGENGRAELYSISAASYVPNLCSKALDVLYFARRSRVLHCIIIWRRYDNGASAARAYYVYTCACVRVCIKYII